MGVIDWILLGVIAVSLIGAVISAVRNRKSCCGDCSSCRGCSRYTKQ